MIVCGGARPHYCYLQLCLLLGYDYILEAWVSLVLFKCKTDVRLFFTSDYLIIFPSRYWSRVLGLRDSRDVMLSPLGSPLGS